MPRRVREIQGVRVLEMSPTAHTENPYVIWPYYTGRDKGAIRSSEPEANGALLGFFTPGRAWKYIFETVQPGDDRACDNYRVVPLKTYLED